MTINDSQLLIFLFDPTLSLPARRVTEESEIWWEFDEVTEGVVAG